VSTLKTSFRFSNGEVAPTYHGASDLQTYLTSLAALRNAYVGKSGGVYSRPGTSYVAPALSGVSVRLFPFIFNADQTYVLEFTNVTMRVIRNGELLTITPQNITGITNANPAVVTYSGADNFVNFSTVLIEGVAGMEEVNGRYFTIGNVNAAANTFELLSVDSSAYGTYTSGGTAAKVYTVTTPWVSADLSTLQFAQDSDTVFITSKSQAPRQLTRSDHTSWTLATITFTTSVTPPGTLTVSNAATPGVTTYQVTAIDPATGEESLASTTTSSDDPFDTSVNNSTTYTPLTLTWTAVAGMSYNVYRTRCGATGLIGVTKLGEFVDNGVPADYTVQPPSIAVSDFNNTDDRPECVSFCQQRTVFANSNNDPDGVWALQIGRPKNAYVRVPPQDDDAFEFRVASRRVNEVRHIVDIGRMLVMTAGGEYEAQGNEAGIVTPTAINLRQVGGYGSSTLPPILVNGNPVFVQARGNVVRDLGREIQGFNYRGNDLTALASHLFDGYTLVDWAYQQVPNSIIWAVRSDGVVLSFTYLPEYQVWAWARHEFWGNVDYFERSYARAVCVVPEGDEDAVYFVVGRNNFATLERLNTRYVAPFELVTVTASLAGLSWYGPRDFVAVDNAITYDGRNTSTSHTMTVTDGSTTSFTGAGASQANPCVITAHLHGLTEGDHISISGVNGMTELNGRNFIVGEVLTVSTFELHDTDDEPVDSSAYTAYTSGGAISRWEADETLTLTSSTSYFSAAEVGNEIHLHYVGPIATASIDVDYRIRDTVRLSIIEYVSATVVRVTASKRVPVTMRATALFTWARAVDEVTELWHLEDESVAIQGDGFVLASPENPAYEAITVEDGAAALPACYAVVHTGSRFSSDFETLDIDTAQGSMSARKKNVSMVTLDCEKTLGVWAGPRNPDTDPLNTDESKVYGLTEAKFREFESPDDPTELRTGKIDVTIQTEWSQGGRIFVRKVDPTPMAILGIAPTFVVGEER
jgi:hypothetical protein